MNRLANLKPNHFGTEPAELDEKREPAVLEPIGNGTSQNRTGPGLTRPNLALPDPTQPYPILPRERLQNHEDRLKNEQNQTNDEEIKN